VEPLRRLSLSGGFEEAIRDHWKASADSFAAHGFGDVGFVLLPGVGHSPCAREVVTFFAGLLP
jgi:hypothetical protein